MIITPDVEQILCQRLREALNPQALAPDWPGLYVSRAKPEGWPDYIVTVQKAGGVPKQRVLDQVRLQVSTWAPTEQAANAFSETVRAALEGLSFEDPFYLITASSPVAVTEKGEPPSRFFHAEALVRRTESA